MSEAHKGLSDRLFRVEKHPEAFLGYLGGLITSLYGEDMAYWHSGALANDGSLGQQYKLGLARGRELVKDAKHLDKSDQEILSLKREVIGYTVTRNQSIEDLKRAKAEKEQVLQEQAEIEQAVLQAKQSLDRLTEQHRSLKVDNFNQAAISQERIEQLRQLDSLREEVSQLQLERTRLILERAETAEATV